MNMEDEQEVTETPEETPEVTPQVGLTPEDLAALRADNSALREQLAEMRGAVDALKAQPHYVQVPGGGQPAETGVSDEELDRAVSEGQGVGNKFRALVDQAVRHATSRIKAEEIDPLKSYGTSALKELASTSIRNLKYYPDYKKEIEMVAAQVPVENLGNPQTWQLIYNNVVGGHADEIETRAVEAAMRQKRDVADGGAPSGGGRQTAAPPKTVHAADLGGRDAEIALRNKGVSEDEMVQRMRIPGVTTWAEYVEMGERLERENG